MGIIFNAQFKNFDTLTGILSHPEIDVFLKPALIKSGAVIVKSAQKKLYKPSDFPNTIHGLNSGTLRRGIRIGDIQESGGLLTPLKWALEIGVFDVPYAHWIEVGESEGYKPKGNTKGTGSRRAGGKKGIKTTKYPKTGVQFNGYQYMETSLTDSFPACLLLMKEAYSLYIDSIKF